jgi:Recombination endonuclease VII
MPHADPERHREYKRQWYSRNRVKIAEENRRRRAANPVRYASEASRAKDRATKKAYMATNGAQIRRKSRHGILPEDWAAMWQQQEGCCYLCGDPLPAEDRQVHIDHDHTCCPPGKSCSLCRRGLACEACNHLVGFARDDPARLRRVADNLERALAATQARMAARAIQGELPFR